VAVDSEYGGDGAQYDILEPRIIGDDLVPHFTFHPDDGKAGSMEGFDEAKAKERADECVHRWFDKENAGNSAEWALANGSQSKPLEGVRTSDIEPWENPSACNRWPRRRLYLDEFARNPYRGTA
jgi:hypothetical protein